MKRKVFGLSKGKIKKIREKSFGVNSTFFIFLRIFILMSFAILPLISHNIITFKHSSLLEDFGNEEASYEYVVAAQAIGYSQPMAFFSISSLAMVIVNIMIFIRRSLDTFNRKNQPKDIINSGIIYMIIFAALLSLLFYIVMIIYCETVIESFKYRSSFLLKQFLKTYASLISVYIILTAISLYYEFLLIECGVNYWKIILLSVFFLFLDIGLSVLFDLSIKDVEPIVSVILGTSISAFLRMIIFIVIFYKKIANWKIWDISWNKENMKNILDSTWMLSLYMFTYGLMMLFQIMFLSIITAKELNEYLVTDKGINVLILTRISIYNIINIINLIPKSMARAVLIKYPERFTSVQRIANFERAKKKCILSLYLMIVVSFIIYAFSDSIIISIYGDFSWANELIPKRYPINYLGRNATYMTMIKKFFDVGLLIGILSQILVCYSIYYRVITYYYLKRSPLNFLIILLTFFIVYSSGNYFLGVYYQYIFRGISGFMITILIFGFLSTLIIWFWSYRCKRNVYNEILIKKYNDYLEHWYTIGFLKYYSKIRFYKKIIMRKYKRKFI